MRDDTIVHCFSVQWDYCDVSQRQDRSVFPNYKERSYCSYLLRYWVAPSSVLWVVQEFFEIKTLDFGAKDLGKDTTKHRTSVLKISSQYSPPAADLASPQKQHEHSLNISANHHSRKTTQLAVNSARAVAAAKTGTASA